MSKEQFRPVISAGSRVDVRPPDTPITKRFNPPRNSLVLVRVSSWNHTFLNFGITTEQQRNHVRQLNQHNLLRITEIWDVNNLVKLSILAPTTVILITPCGRSRD